MLFVHNGTNIEKVFGVKLITSADMNTTLKLWDHVSTGAPPWLDSDDDIWTINMAKHISDYRARLTTLDVQISLTGSPRAEYLQTIVDDLLKRLPDRVSEADRLGGMIIKWNGDNWDFVLPGNFGITAKDSNGEITGAIFAAYSQQGRTQYTRLEYHRFDGKIYKITNKAFKNQMGPGETTVLGAEVALSKVDAWAHMQPETSISNLEHPLFAFYRVPGSNTIDSSSPLGQAVFANALTELRDIDIAISRKGSEIEDSKHVTFVGQALVQNAQNRKVKLPRWVQGLGMGLNDTETSAIHEHAPVLLTDERIKDLNFDLSMAGVKCGFSEGVFVLDGQTGMITATQVESDDRDTIQTIKDDRTALQGAIERAIEGADALVTLYSLAPLGEYEVGFKFGDITYNYAEDKAQWFSYVLQGKVPMWYFLQKFEGMTEEDAKALTAAAAAEQIQEKVLFAAE